MKRRLPPLNALRAFEAAARLGRMTAAADELAVTPGAISRQVQQLEQSLGTVLFEGSKNRPQLSAMGRQLLPALTAAFDQMDIAVNAVRDDSSGTLDICCFNTFTVKWLIPRLFDFNSRYPDIDIRLSSADHRNNAHQTKDMAQERYDLVIRVEDMDEQHDNRILPLFQEWLGPVLSPALAVSFSIQTAADLSGKPLLHTRTRANAWQMWGTAANCAVPDTEGQEFEHYYFTLEAAIAGLGICIAPWHLVQDDIRSGRLIAPLGFSASTYRYVAQRSRKQDKKLDLFCTWLQNQAQLCPLPTAKSDNLLVS